LRQGAHEESGHALFEQLFGLVAGKAYGWFLAIVVLVAITAQEWVRYFYPSTTPPIAVTLLTLAVAVIGILKMRQALHEAVQARSGRRDERALNPGASSGQPSRPIGRSPSG
jgi:MFS superfamily sulfate permease-like transporter